MIMRKSWTSGSSFKFPRDAVEFLKIQDHQRLQMPVLYSRFRWLDIKPHHLPFYRINQPADYKWLLCIASLNGAGITREAAVRAMSEDRQDIYIPFLLWRLRDWAVQVQQTAAMTLNAYYSPEHADAIMMQLPMLKQLSKINRPIVSTELDRIWSFLISQRLSHQKWSQSDHAMVRRQTYELMLKAEHDKSSVLEMAANDIEPSNRRWLVSQIEHLEPDARVNWEIRLLNDTNALVQSHMLSHLSWQSIVQIQDRLIKLLVSPNWNLRYMTALSLRNWDRSAFAIFYRKKLQETNWQSESADTLAGCLGGLGDWGNDGDFETVISHFDSTISKIRAESLRSACQLDRQKASPFLTKAVLDESKYVRQIAVANLKRDMKPEELDELLKRLAETKEYVHVSQIFRVLVHQSWWTLACGILLAASSEQDEIVSQAVQTVKRHFSKYEIQGWLKPSAFEHVWLNKARNLYLAKGLSPQDERDRWNAFMRWTNKVLG